MTRSSIAAALLAAALAFPCRPASAQVADRAADRPAAQGHAAPKPRTAHRKPAAAARPDAASPAFIVPPSSGAAADSSLERRRKAFFAKPDEAGGAASDPTPPVGVTLGGSGGLTPGMGFKF